MNGEMKSGAGNVKPTLKKMSAYNDPHAVHYKWDSKTEEEKEQARFNIGAADAKTQAAHGEQLAEQEKTLAAHGEEVAEHDERMTQMEARMNTFASLPDGSTTGDAEIADIRVGYDNKTYPTAGEAVRAQVGKLTEEIRNYDIYKKILSANDDINNLENGSYRWNSSSVPANVPVQGSGVLLQFGGPSGSGGCQIIGKLPGNRFFYRTRSSSSWGAYDEILTMDEFQDMMDEFQDMMDEIRGIIDKYTMIDAFESTNGSSKTYPNGISFTKNDDNSWTINGSADDGSAFANILSYSSQLPDTIVPGRTYYIQFLGADIPLRIYLYDTEGNEKLINITNSAEIEVPENTKGIIVRFQISAGMTYDNAVAKYAMLCKPPFSNAESGTVINKTVYENRFESTYNITCTPEIIVDSNGYLQAVDTASEDETGKTDMTGAIMAMLSSTGYCKLGAGVFYVSGNINMPYHSTLEGCGDATEIRLLASVESGYVIKPTQYCTIKNLSLRGSHKIPSITSEIGQRHGILFSANADGNEGDSTEDVLYSNVSNVFIRYFTGSGIKLHNTGLNYAHCLYVSDTFIAYCHTGINIDYFSEFNKFVNCLMTWCYYACVNNGGNNAFSNCTFHATNTGFLIDNSEGDKPNIAHGLCVGGTFCHIGSNQGSAITVKNSSSGYVFTGCQVHHNSIDIENSYGLVFNAIQFGRGTTGKGATINIDGGGLVMFNGCMFANEVEKPPQIAITNNDMVKFVNCFGSHTGNPITAN